jgi:hypothetical protein
MEKVGSGINNPDQQHRLLFTGKKFGKESRFKICIFKSLSFCDGFHRQLRHTDMSLLQIDFKRWLLGDCIPTLALSANRVK